MLLTSCMSREDADARLQKGCEAIIPVIETNDYTLKQIDSVKTKPSAAFGNGYREVMILAVMHDGWHEYNEEYKCVFAEEYNKLMSSHKAVLYQITAAGQQYGMHNGQVMGDSQMLIKLENAASNAMR